MNLKLKSFIMKKLFGAGCFIQSLVLVVYGYFACISVNYITNYFDKDLHWVLDLIIGFFSGTVSLWVAFILWLVS